MQLFSFPERSLERKSPTQSLKQLFMMPIIMFMEAIWAISSYWFPPLPPKDILIIFYLFVNNLIYAAVIYILYLNFTVFTHFGTVVAGLDPGFG
jgi:hypothetical protein